MRGDVLSGERRDNYRGILLQRAPPWPSVAVSPDNRDELCVPLQVFSRI